MVFFSWAFFFSSNRLRRSWTWLEPALKPPEKNSLHWAQVTQHHPFPPQQHIFVTRVDHFCEIIVETCHQDIKQVSVIKTIVYMMIKLFQTFVTVNVNELESKSTACYFSECQALNVFPRHWWTSIKTKLKLVKDEVYSSMVLH